MNESKGTLYKSLFDGVSKVTTLKTNAFGKLVGPMIYAKKSIDSDGHNITKDVYVQKIPEQDSTQIRLTDMYYIFPNPEKDELGGWRTYTKRIEFSPLDEDGKGVLQYDLTPEYGEPKYIQMNGGELMEFLDAMGIDLDGPFNPESIMGETAYKLR